MEDKNEQHKSHTYKKSQTNNDIFYTFDNNNNPEIDLTAQKSKIEEQIIKYLKNKNITDYNKHNDLMKIISQIERNELLEIFSLFDTTLLRKLIEMFLIQTNTNKTNIHNLPPPPPPPPFPIIPNTTKLTKATSFDHLIKDQQPEWLQNYFLHSYQKFSCFLCHKQFSNNSRLNAHMKVHSPDRPFKCPNCDKRFARKHHMRDHVLVVHQHFKPFECPQCFKKFGKRSTLVRHTATHSNSNLTRFVSMNSRSRHLKMPKTMNNSNVLRLPGTMLNNDIKNERNKMLFDVHEEICK